MPRGRKSSVDYETQLQLLDEKIEKHTRQIAALKDRRASIAEHQRIEAVRALSDYLETHHLTPDELVAQLPVSAGAVLGKK